MKPEETLNRMLEVIQTKKPEHIILFYESADQIGCIVYNTCDTHAIGIVEYWRRRFGLDIDKKQGINE